MKFAKEFDREIAVGSRLGLRLIKFCPSNLPHETIPWHHRCMLFQQMDHAFWRWRMPLYTTVEDQIIDIVCRTPACGLEDLVHRCPNLTWNQLFLAVDHLSRTGEVRLVPAKGGGYIVSLVSQQKQRPERYFLPS